MGGAGLAGGTFIPLLHILFALSSVLCDNINGAFKLKPFDSAIAATLSNILEIDNRWAGFGWRHPPEMIYLLQWVMENVNGAYKIIIKNELIHKLKKVVHLIYITEDFVKKMKGFYNSCQNPKTD